MGGLFERHNVLVTPKPGPLVLQDRAMIDVCSTLRSATAPRMLIEPWSSQAVPHRAIRDAASPTHQPSNLGRPSAAACGAIAAPSSREQSFVAIRTVNQCELRTRHDASRGVEKLDIVQHLQKYRS